MNESLLGSVKSYNITTLGPKSQISKQKANSPPQNKLDLDKHEGALTTLAQICGPFS